MIGEDGSEPNRLDRLVHELRTPLSSVLAALELLADGVRGPLSPSQLDLVMIALRNVDRVNVLVGRIAEPLPALPEAE